MDSRSLNKPTMDRLIDNLISALNICCKNKELDVVTCKKFEQILMYNLDKCQQLMCLLTRYEHLKKLLTEYEIVTTDIESVLAGYKFNETSLIGESTASVVVA